MVASPSRSERSVDLIVTCHDESVSNRMGSVLSSRNLRGTMGVAQRSENLRRLDGGDFDVVVIGGGINSAVSAAALQAVVLRWRSSIEVTSFTSQESSNLVWGGFKYRKTTNLASSTGCADRETN